MRNNKEDESVLPADKLRSIMSYDPETGYFARKNGRKVGRIFDDSYIRIKIDGKEYQAHRLAWLHMTGCMPVHSIDTLTAMDSTTSSQT